jgi:hypothetical protein
MDYSELLPFCKNDMQRDTITALTDTGSIKKASKALGIHRATTYRRVEAIRKEAERRGHIPAHKALGTVAAGFYAETSVKRRLNPETNEMEVIEDWTKSRLDKTLMAEAFTAFVQGICESLKPAKPRSLNHKKYSKDLANAIILGDAHIGMLAHAVETNDEDYNLETAICDLRAGIDYLVDCSPVAEQGWFLNVGDFTHADNTHNTTTGGTKQDVAGRQFEVMEAAGKLMRYAVDKMLTKFKRVTVINARGNHDNDTAFALNMVLQAVYENEPRVEVQGNRSKFNYIEFGTNLIGLNHGDKINTSRLVGTMTKQMAEAWGRTTFRRWWIGHIHHKTKQETDFGCTVESFNTLAPLESWHSASGYGAERRITMITLHRDFGEVFRMEPSIQLVRSMAA